MNQSIETRDQIPGDSTGATATAVATISDGQVTAISVTHPGFGYTAAPNVAITGGGGAGATSLATLANDGSISAIKVVTGGRGYSSTPTVNISLDGGPALLDYGILPSPNPLQLPQTDTQLSQLTLNVSNPGSDLVSCSSIAVLLPGPSELAQDLTDSFNGIGVLVPSVDNTPQWTVTQNGGSFTLTPISSQIGQIGAAGVFFVFYGILINNSVGLCRVNISETSSSPAAPSGIRAAPPIAVEKWPSQFSISGPTAKPLEVLYDGFTDVTWVVTGANVTTSLLYDPDGNGTKSFNVSNTGSKRVDHITNSAGVTFTIQATVPVAGSDPMVQQRQVFVSVVPNPTIDFEIHPNPVTAGQPITFTLDWKLVDVTNFQITANDGPNGSTYALPVPFSTEGTYPVSPKKLSVTYTLVVLSTGAGMTARLKEKK